MVWYKFRAGQLTREETVGGEPQACWTIDQIYWKMFNNSIDSNPDYDCGQSQEELAQIVTVGLIDHNGDKVPMSLEDLLFRMKPGGYGWGRMFSDRPGKLVGYRTATGERIITCRLTAPFKNEQHVYTWVVEQDTLDIAPLELWAFVWQIRAVNYLDINEYPMLA